MSLDTGLRKEGLPASTLWDTVIDVLAPLASRARNDPSRQLKSKTSKLHGNPLITFHQTLRSPVTVLIC